MKSFVTALAICALLMTSGTAYAVDYNWVGDEGDAAWCNMDGNWNQAGCPDDSGDTATITSKTTRWPQLDNNYTVSNGNRNIDDLTMGGANTDLDVNSYTLECDVFTVNSGSSITISNSSSGGGITAASFVVNGASTITVSGTTTVQTN